MRGFSRITILLSAFVWGWIAIATAYLASGYIGDELGTTAFAPDTSTETSPEVALQASVDNDDDDSGPALHEKWFYPQLAENTAWHFHSRPRIYESICASVPHRPPDLA